MNDAPDTPHPVTVEDLDDRGENLAWSLGDLSARANTSVPLGGGAVAETGEFDVAARAAEPVGDTAPDTSAGDEVAVSGAGAAGGEGDGSGGGGGSQVPQAEMIRFMGGFGS